MRQARYSARCSEGEPRMEQSAPADQEAGVSLCMIVRDEATRLRACLESVRPWVSEMVVVDTGSTDDTLAIARSLGARVGEFAWCDDFAAARNAALALTRGRWILWLDADELLDSDRAARLPLLVDRSAGAKPLLYRVLVRHWREDQDGAGGTVLQYSGRLFERHPQVLWSGIIHERVVHLHGSDQLEVVTTDDIVIDHSGHADAARRAKRTDERNVRLLQKAVERHPHDGFYRAKLGAHFLEASDPDAAVTHLTAAVSLSYNQAWAAYRASAFSSLVAANLARGDLQAAVAAGREGLATFNDYPPLWWQTGVALLLAGEWESARQCLLNARACGDVSRKYALDHSTATWRPLVGLATIAELEGNWSNARNLLDEARTAAPSQRDVLLGLARVACATEDWNSASAALRDFEASSNSADDSLEVARLQAQIYRGQGETQAAYDLLEHTLAAHPDSLAVRLDLAKLLRDAGEATVALGVLEPVLDETSPPAHYYECLATVLDALDRRDDAAAARTLAEQVALPPVSPTPSAGSASP